MARRKANKKRKTGCLLPIVIFIVTLGILGSVGSDNTSSTPSATVSVTAEITAIVETPAVSPTASSSVAVTDIPTAIPTATSKPVATPTNKTEQTYILNTSTRKFHYHSCSSVGKIKEANKGSFTGTREELIKRGYSPCGNCHP